jgi:putative ABC transport system permease protein
MMQYYFMLGLKSLRRNPWLTSLMLLTLAVGVAASVATLTILITMSGDPIPSKSARLLVPLIDNAPADNYVAGTAQEQTHLPYKDVVAFLASKQGSARTAIYSLSGPVEQPQSDLPTMEAVGIATTDSYFYMFEVPFRHGNAWRAEDEAAKAKVIVLGRSLSEKLFGVESPVGKTVKFRNIEYTISGVVDKWDPQPAFTNVHNGPRGLFNGEDDVYIPFSTAIDNQFTHDGSTWCTGDGSEPGYQGLLNSECTWIQFWFELAKPSDRSALLDYLKAYTSEQRQLKRYMRNNVDQLFDVNEWLVHRKVVGDDRKLSVWISFGFLLLCIVNTVGLLLAKYSTRASEVGVRRALGASQMEIFKQFLIETAVLGFAGGALGLILSFGALWLFAQQSKDMAAVASMNWGMMMVTFYLSVGASLIAGVLPAWRACRVSPAAELKSQ